MFFPGIFKLYGLVIQLAAHSNRDITMHNPGADPGFQVRGGALKKIAPSGGRREKVGVFRVKNHYFTPKNRIFFNFRGKREKFGGISCGKTRFYAKKSYFFPILGGVAGRAPSESAPATEYRRYVNGSEQLSNEDERPLVLIVFILQLCDF